ncbi:WD40 repeat-like protein [Wilcoxina mikolae CBS 423.85]|nr:WD40 repeat-like protein [Wilcoxina mikolae CBS 423.85]
MLSICGSSRSAITSIAFSEALQTIFVGFRDGAIACWTLEITDDSNEDILAVRKSSETFVHNGGVKFLQVIPGDPERLASIGCNDSVIIWCHQSGEMVRSKTLFGYESIIPPRSFSSLTEVVSGAVVRRVQQFLVFVSEDDSLNLWNLDDYSSIITGIDGVGLISAMDIDGQNELLAVGTADGMVIVCRLDTLSCVLRYHIERAVKHLSFIPDYDKTEASTGVHCKSAIVTTYCTQVWNIAINDGNCPQEIWIFGCNDTNVLDIYAFNDDFILVMLRDGTKMILRCNTDNALSSTFLEPLPPVIDSAKCLALCFRQNYNTIVTLSGDSNGALTLECLDITGWASPIRDYMRHRDGFLLINPKVAEVPRMEIGHDAKMTHYSIIVSELEDHAAIVKFTTPNQCIGGDDASAEFENCEDDLQIVIAQPNADFCSALETTRRKIVNMNTDTGIKDDASEDDTCQHPVHEFKRTRPLYVPRGGCGALLERVERPIAPPPPPEPSIEMQQLESVMPLDVQGQQALAERLAQHIHNAIWEADHGDVVRGLRKQHERQTHSAVNSGARQPSTSNGSVQREDTSILREGQPSTSHGSVKAENSTVNHRQKITNRAKRERHGMRRCWNLSRWQMHRHCRKHKKTVMPPDKFGFHDGRHEETIRQVLDWYPQAKNARKNIIGPITQPRTPQESARLHAEMQIISQSLSDNKPTPIIGVSKPACLKCREVLEELGSVGVGVEGGNTNPRNWARPESVEKQSRPDNRETRTIFEIPHDLESEHIVQAGGREFVRKQKATGLVKKVANSYKVQFYNPAGSVNVSNPKEAVRAVKRSVVRGARPRVTASVGAMIER